MNYLSNISCFQPTINCVCIAHVFCDSKILSRNIGSSYPKLSLWRRVAILITIIGHVVELWNINQFELILAKRTSNTVLINVVHPCGKLHTQTLSLSIALDNRTWKTYFKKVNCVLTYRCTSWSNKSYSATQAISHWSKIHTIIKPMCISTSCLQLLKLIIYCILDHDSFYTRKLLYFVLYLLSHSVKYSWHR